ncbi:hypothetical protein AAHE18_15G254100 [Arachis hypogaea]
MYVRCKGSEISLFEFKVRKTHNKPIFKMICILTCTELKGIRECMLVFCRGIQLTKSDSNECCNINHWPNTLYQASSLSSHIVTYPQTKENDIEIMISSQCCLDIGMETIPHAITKVTSCITLPFFRRKAG